MKKFFFCLLIIFIPVISISQIPVATHQQVKAFYDTKTMVVLEGGMLSMYNPKIQEVVKKFWKATDYKFISMDEFDQKKNNPDYSFLMLVKINYYKEDRVDTEYSFLSLMLGKKGAREVNDLPDLCSFPLAYADVDQDSYLYKLGAAVKFMQRHVKNTLDNPDLNTDNIIRHYMKNTEAIEGKTLYLLADDMEDDIDTPREVKKYYDGKVEFVTPEKIEQAIDNSNADVVFLHKVGPGPRSKKARCFKLIVGADNAELYYFKFHKINRRKPDGFLVKDLRKLNRQD